MVHRNVVKLIKPEDSGAATKLRENIVTVRNGTALLSPEGHFVCMSRKKAQKERRNTVYAGVKKEMAQPRMAKSARIAVLNLETARIPEPPSTSMPGTVDRIIPSSRRRRPEKAQLAVSGPDHRNQDLRIENALTDENGDDVKLKKGAHVDVTVTARDVIRHRSGR